MQPTFNYIVWTLIRCGCRCCCEPDLFSYKEKIINKYVSVNSMDRSFATKLNQKNKCDQGQKIHSNSKVIILYITHYSQKTIIVLWCLLFNILYKL
jgi:hypothetical protein